MNTWLIRFPGLPGQALLRHYFRTICAILKWVNMPLDFIEHLSKVGQYAPELVARSAFFRFKETVSSGLADYDGCLLLFLSAGREGQFRSEYPHNNFKGFDCPTFGNSCKTNKKINRPISINHYFLYI